ncbi:SusD/RagB family nutrient-binding outer membrane lipoprotein [Xylanibacter caecicola]|uniref:SusD/RagB family nutrient-binding outer membrane lipoprotein n=1 Tax=Xylanibacter caecicola TaxID=2736294 RepID=UPI00258E2E57|nr:SusD/RagB family nutrient-binding outer membrane lipoprotein [Xylanibacter caecicola]
MKKNIFILLFSALVIGGVFTSCSDSYMEKMNTDGSKSKDGDPNTLLTTTLLQTYGDFSFMDTFRSYITGFTQQFAGGWNVSNFAGSVHAQDDQSSKVWDRYYTIGIKDLADAIANSTDKPNLNAVLRIHFIYMISVLTDIYGDVPCMEAGQGYLKGIPNPRYDKQEDIYNFFFTELAACAEQLGTGTDRITGDVTSMAGNPDAWKRYANSLRMRFAMRISDVNPQKAQEEFEKALTAAGGYITDAADNAYIKYSDNPFTLYDGANDLDFRVNALGEILYGQDPTSPSFICSTLYNMMKETNDPRLQRICRHYINTKRSEIRADYEGNVDVTDEVYAYLDRIGDVVHPCNPGAAWWNNWVNAPANSEIPTLDALVKSDPDAGYDKNNYPARMMRPAYSIDFCQAACPGILITSAETEFLLAEAKSKGWNVPGTVESHFVEGIKATMRIMNNYYLKSNKISDDEIDSYVASVLASGKLDANPREAINTQAWMLHLTNPSECWANLRRSDYPVLQDRNKLDKFPSDFTYDDDNLTTPTRLRYPQLEAQYNSANYNEAIERLGGTDDWHKRVWWDANEGNYK